VAAAARVDLAGRVAEELPNALALVVIVGVDDDDAVRVVLRARQARDVQDVGAGLARGPPLDGLVSEAVLPPRESLAEGFLALAGDDGQAGAFKCDGVRAEDFFAIVGVDRLRIVCHVRVINIVGMIERSPCKTGVGQPG
jgi:hypothetical protein